MITRESGRGCAGRSTTSHAGRLRRHAGSTPAEGLFVGQEKWLGNRLIGAESFLCYAAEKSIRSIERNMDHRLLEIIACPVCNGKLYYSQDKQELILQTGQSGVSAA